jgi:hypothetical protein
MATNFVDWSWSSEHVQTEIVNGEYLSSETALLLAGPPRLGQVNAASTYAASNQQAANDLNEISDNTTILFPLGLLADATLQQGRNIRPVFEIGSVRRYLIPEKVSTSLRVSRVKFYGPSLLRVLYAYYPNELLGGTSGTFATALPANAPGLNVPSIGSGEEPGFGRVDALPVGANFGVSPEEANDPRNNRDWWVNLQSVVFRQPLGLCMYLKASNDSGYGAAYMEDCYISRHGFSLNAEQVMMMEAVDIELDRIRPIRLTQPPRSVFGAQAQANQNAQNDTFNDGTQ